MRGDAGGGRVAKKPEARFVAGRYGVVVTAELVGAICVELGGRDGIPMSAATRSSLSILDRFFDFVVKVAIIDWQPNGNALLFGNAFAKGPGARSGRRPVLMSAVFPAVATPELGIALSSAACGILVRFVNSE